jgi:hypothetical protein
MDTLSALQQEIAEARARLAAADDAYYQALQAWSLSGEGAERLGPLRQLRETRDAAQASLDGAIVRLAALGEPATLIEQVPADCPFLLLPLRLEARYLTRLHVVRDLDPGDLVDVANLPLAGRLANPGFKTDEDGVTSYQVPALDSLRVPPPLLQALREAALQVRSGSFIRRKPDREELWIRIYPDEVFTEALERSLLATEAEAGRAFWGKIWAGVDADEAWLGLADGTTAPRAAWILHATRPTNFRPGAPLDAAPRFPEVPLKDGPYTRAPVGRLLPERFVVRLTRGRTSREFTGRPVPEPLPLGLDPTLDPLAEDAESAFVSEKTTLRAPASLRWVHDLEAAERAGLAIRVDLAQHPEFQDGVDSIVVLGAKLSADAAEGARLLDAHLENCLYKEKGLGILPQGTPTNKSERETGTRGREAEARRVFGALWAPSAGPGSDEARLRGALGLREDLHFPDGHVTDIDEALTMNRLLWPATFGYYLLNFFTPDLAEATREQVRLFFTRYVSGRGLLPVLRMNSQPYGVIPITSFDHWTYGPGPVGEEAFLAGLWTGFLSRLSAQWKAMAAQVAAENAAAASSHHLDEAFLRMMGMSAASVRFHKQMMVGAGFQEALRSIQPAALTELSRDASFNPRMRGTELAAAGLDPAHYRTLTDSYSSPQDRRRIRWHAVDALPMSEERGLQRLPEKAWNYLEWLAQARLEHIWTLDFSGVPPGDEPLNGNAAAFTLLARLCRQAVLRTFLEAGLRKTEPNPGLWLLKARDLEPEHLHDRPIAVNPAALVANNKLHQLYRPVIQRFGLTAPFTLDPDRWSYLKPIAPQLDQPGADPALQGILEMKAALTRLSRLPTARLERLLTEHLDLCSHRLDAWMLGLVNQRLDKQRAAKPRGIGLGAFGYLLDLKPASRRAVRFVEETPERLPAAPENLPHAAIPVVNLDLALEQGISPSRNWDRVYFYIGEQGSPAIRLDTRTGTLEPDDQASDAGSHGYLHAPSLGHAAAAAILYAGHLNHKQDTSAESLAIKLNAPRTRMALELLQGMQRGATLAELLGYHLERSLHERGLDAFLHDVRKAFPLRRAEAPNAPPQPLTTTDGLAVVEAFRKTPVPALLNSVAAAVRDIEDRLDAVGDLLLAESVFQTAQGSTERAAAALRTLNSGGQVVMPEFIRTPQHGMVINHRVGIVFEPGGPDDTGHVWARPGTSPRTSLNRRLNRWLARQLPAPQDIAIALTLPDGVRKKLTVKQLGIEPIDFLHACPAGFDQGDASPLAVAASLKARELFGVAEMEAASQPGETGNGSVPSLRVDFKSRDGFRPGDVSVFEVSAIVACLRKLAAESRFLAPDDFHLPGAPRAGDDKIKPANVLSALEGLRAGGGPLTVAATRVRQAATQLAAALRAAEPLPVHQAGEALHRALYRAWLHGSADAAGGNLSDYSPASTGLLMERAEQVARDLEQRRAALDAAMGSIPAGLAGAPLFRRLEEAAAAVFGRGLRLFPEIELESASKVAAALGGRALLDNADPDAVDRWMQQAALTRQPLRAFRRAVLLREALGPAASDQDLAIVQLPFRDGQRQAWIGGPFSPDADSSDLAFVSLVLESGAAIDPRSVLSGMMVDEWPEFVPSRTARTGVAFHYNQPNSEPPQALLLAVAPVEGGNWRWEYLRGAVMDALALAQKRLVTPANVTRQNAALAHVLPAVALPLTPEENRTPNVEVL